MLRVWIIFLGVAVAASCLTLTRIQLRAARRLGWRGLARRSPRETYWADISPVERGLLWCGLVAFVFTLIALTAWQLLARGA